MECPQVNQHLPEYLSGTLSPPLRLDVEAHWNTCPACRNEAEELGELWSDLDTVRPEAPSAEARVRFDAMLHAFDQGLTAGEGRGGGTSLWTRWNRTMNDGIGRWWPRQPVWQVAAALVLTVAGTALGVNVRSSEPASPADGFVSLEQEVRTLQQLVALSMLDQRSASQRIQGVGWTSQIERPGDEILSTLVDTLDFDPNINVRLAAVSVLGQFADAPLVREGVVRSLTLQESPMIQVALIDLLVQLDDERSVAIFEQLVADDMVDATVRERAAWGLEQLG